MSVSAQLAFYGQHWYHSWRITYTVKPAYSGHLKTVPPIFHCNDVCIVVICSTLPAATIFGTLNTLNLSITPTTSYIPATSLYIRSLLTSPLSGRHYSFYFLYVMISPSKYHHSCDLFMTANLYSDPLYITATFFPPLR